LGRRGSRLNPRRLNLHHSGADADVLVGQRLVRRNPAADPFDDARVFGELAVIDAGGMQKEAQYAGLRVSHGR
jgi:hypothetical protein